MQKNIGGLVCGPQQAILHVLRVVVEAAEKGPEVDTRRMACGRLELLQCRIGDEISLGIWHNFEDRLLSLKFVFKN